MSVRVNLLPEATRANSRAARQRAVAGLVAVAFLGSLGTVYWWASGQVSAAETELADAEALTGQLHAEAGELQAFKELADRRDRSDEILTAALADEVSLAGLLQDLAAVVPSDTQLDSLALQVHPGEAGEPIGSFNASGRTLTSHAPGVERVLIQLEKVSSFVGLYLNSSTLEDPDERIASFQLDGSIDPSSSTGRYANGLPEELR